MKFAVLALDYDGTIAEHGVLNPRVAEAVGEARARGITVVLVTGRRLDALRQAMGDPGLFDAIVGENGAVLEFARGGAPAVLGAPPPAAFLCELTRRGIEWTRGACVVEADARAAHDILDVIREQGWPLVLAFNRGRVMALPQGISKATGLRAALEGLRLSEHNAIGIGDAENDHTLLQACEIGVAAGWGSPALAQVADEVLPGSGPEAVAGYIREAARHARLSPVRTGRRRLLLGHLSDGTRLELAVHGRNVLVAGDPRTGKSWVTGLLCEQLILQRYSLCVIDPEGDYSTLQALPGVVVLGGDHPPPAPRDLLRMLRRPDVSTVIDLTRLDPREKRRYVAAALPLLASLRRQHGVPHRIVLDEAHYFLDRPEAAALTDLELAGYTLVTYRASQLPPAVLAASEAVIVTRLSDEREVRALAEAFCPIPAPPDAGGGPGGAPVSVAEWAALLGGLALHEAVLLPSARESEGVPRRFVVASRTTPHTRHREKYLDVPLPERRAFDFTLHGTPTGERARTAAEFAGALEHCQPEVLHGHLHRGDFSRWLDEALRDRRLASRFGAVEQQYRQRQLESTEARLLLLQALQE